MRKISTASQRDFWGYVRFARQCRDFRPYSGPLLPATQKRRAAPSALRCFVTIESQGLRAFPDVCRQPRLFNEAIHGKALVNCHIRMWAQGFWSCGGLVWPETEMKTDRDLEFMPDWVWKAVQAQCAKYQHYARPSSPAPPRTF